ncbi:BON domain-containing protein [Aromatoleum sp.]|uniref:BON domain-containing protein n=1 Tax=Aromatoleum sp. TaxID=2307007 RepID=UPI002FC8E845
MKSRHPQPSQFHGERDPNRTESMRGGYGSEYGRQRGGYPEHEEEQYAQQQRRSGGFQDYEGRSQPGGFVGPSDYGRQSQEDYGGEEGFRGSARGQEGQRYGGGPRGEDQGYGRGSHGGGNWGREEQGARPVGGGRGWTSPEEYDEPRFGYQGGLRRGFGRDDFGSENQWTSNDASRSTYGGRTSNSAASQLRGGMSRDYGGEREEAGERGGGTPGYGGDTGGDMGGGYGSGEMGGRFGSSDMSRGFGGSPTAGGYSGGQSSGGYGGGQLGGGYAGQDLDRNRQGPRGYQRSDERIREFICERLAQHHHLDVHDVSVEVREGRVMLDGTVPERRMKYQIEDAADNTWGVKDVENRIRVVSPSGRPGSGQEDLSSGQLSSGGTTGGGSTGLSGTTGSTTAEAAGGPGSSSQAHVGTQTGMTSPKTREKSHQGRDKE